MFSLKVIGEYRRTRKFLDNLKQLRIIEILNKYGELGVKALQAATPEDTGRTSSMWNYEIAKDDEGYVIYFTNDNFNEGVNIAIILQYGHATGTGGYFSGVDYINPTMAPIFEQLTGDAWNEVTKL